jgi:hypothetical protein
MAEVYDFTATVAPGASATKGLIYLASTAGQPFRIVELEISMDGGATTYWPKVNTLLFTGAFTAPTGGTTLVISKANDAAQGKTAATTGKFGTFTSEATGGTSVTRRGVYLPNSSPYPAQWPLGREPLYVPVSAGLIIQVVTPAGFANNAAINGVIEE